MSTVYQDKGGSTTGSSVVITLDNPVGSNRSLVLQVGREGSTDRTFTPSDDQSGTWAQIFNQTGLNGRENQCSYCLNAVAGTTAITVTASGSGAFSARVLEVDRLHATLADDTRGTSDESTTSSSHNCADSPGITTANNVLILGFGQTGASLFTITPPSGHTLATGVRTSTMMSYKLEPSGVSGAQAGWSQSGSARQVLGALQALRFATSTNYTLTANVGSFALSGQAAALSVRVPSDVGTFVLSGQAATLKKGYLLTCAAGSFALSGQAAALLLGRRLTAAGGSFSLTGNDADIIYQQPGQYVLAANRGLFTLSGQPASLVLPLRIVAIKGNFVLSGQSADLIYQPSTPPPRVIGMHIRSLHVPSFSGADLR